jgi:hypothetical protein
MQPTPFAFDHQPAHDPSALYRYRDGISGVDLLIASVIHLRLFDLLARGPISEPDLCRELDIQARPGDVMVTLLASLGLVSRANGLIHATALATEHLAPDAPWNLTPYYASMKDRAQVLDMLKVMRTGKQAMWSGEAAKAWAEAMEREDFARSFTAAMDSRGILMGPRLAEAVDLSRQGTFLDIAGGSGIFACAVKHRHPGLHAAVLEKKPVDEVCRRSIANRGFAGRVEVLTADMFQDDWPTAFDTHLLSNVLHDWDVPEVLTLLRRSHAALPAGGMLLIHDAFLNAAKTGPVEVAEYSALLMQITEGKCYSTAEMDTLLREAGFRVTDHRPTAVHRSVMVAFKT